MARSSADAVRDLLDEHGRTFAAEAGIRLRDQPAPLCQLLVLTSLLSANLDARLGLRAARAVFDEGWTTAAHLADASDDDRHRVLAEAKYLRKRQTAHQLGQLAERLVEEHDGDLRRLRDSAAGGSGSGGSAGSGADGSGAGGSGSGGALDVDVLTEGLTGFAGIGPLGAQIFLREVQTVWTDLRPYADDAVLDLARDRGLPHTAAGLAHAAGTDDLSVVGAALIRADRA